MWCKQNKVINYLIRLAFVYIRYAKEVKNCEGTYSWGGTTTTPSVSSCSSNNISCGSSTVGKTYVGCSRNYGCGSGTTELGGNCINKT